MIVSTDELIELEITVESLATFGTLTMSSKINLLIFVELSVEGIISAMIAELNSMIGGEELHL